MEIATIKNNKSDIITNLKYIERVRKYYEKFFISKFKNLDKIGKFLEKAICRN